MSTLLQPGTYKGQILDYGIKKTSKGDPSPTIAFEVHDSAGVVHKVYWQGSWNGKALDLTMEALLVCGLKSPQSLKHLAEGNISGVLDRELVLDLDIGIEVNSNDPSKKYNRVNWINLSGAAKFKDAMSIQEFAPEIESRGLIVDLMRVAQEKGYDLSKTRASSGSNAEIPF